MINFIIALALLGFMVFGFREGITKAIVSILLVFFCLFLATGVVNFLGQSSPEFNRTDYFAATVTFLIVFVVSYGILDLILTIVLRKVITIIILGPFDRVGGIFFGTFKGLIILGVLLQLVINFPIATATKQSIINGPSSRFCIATYHWFYPYVLKLAPPIREQMNDNLVQKIAAREGLTGTGKEIEKVNPQKILEKAMGEDSPELKELSSKLKLKTKKTLGAEEVLKKAEEVINGPGQGGDSN